MQRLYVRGIVVFACLITVSSYHPVTPSGFLFFYHWFYHPVTPSGLNAFDHPFVYHPVIPSEFNPASVRANT